MSHPAPSRLLYGSAFLSSLVSAALFNPCPLLGPVYPAPTALSSSPVIQAAFSNPKNDPETLLAADNSSSDPYPPARVTTWSIGMFSTTDNSSDPFWQWYYMAASVANSSSGVHTADTDSVYRIGSISKLITVYTMIPSVGNGY